MSRMYLSSPHMGGDELELVKEAFATNWIAPTGPMVNAFENELARLTGIEHVAALSSGTAALHLALRLSGAGPGDEVWGATMTFIGGVAPICYVGAEPVFLDIEQDGLMLDLDLLEVELEAADKDGRLPKVLITTDLYGHAIDVARVERLRERYGFVWISDSAEAVGSYRDGRHAGCGADFTILSFNGNKIITTSGGGALASGNAAAIERARFLSTQAREPAAHYEHLTYGYNYRLSNVCAAIGVGQLRVLSNRVEARRRVHETYRRLLGDIDGITFSPEPEGLRSNRWLTTILIDPSRTGFGREQARLALEKEDIESRPLWKPMHMQPLFANARRVGGDVAEHAFDVGLCLPSGSQMTTEDVERVVNVLTRLRDHAA
jgi:pyridoxal phosphate-dependent aminotransferase EpsN